MKGLSPFQDRLPQGRGSRAVMDGD